VGVGRCEVWLEVAGSSGLNGHTIAHLRDQGN
jgi:hypothetical protein